MSWHSQCEMRRVINCSGHRTIHRELRSNESLVFIHIHYELGKNQWIEKKWAKVIDQCCFDQKVNVDANDAEVIVYRTITKFDLVQRWSEAVQITSKRSLDMAPNAETKPAPQWMSTDQNTLIDFTCPFQLLIRVHWITKILMIRQLRSSWKPCQQRI